MKSVIALRRFTMSRNDAQHCVDVALNGIYRYTQQGPGPIALYIVKLLNDFAPACRDRFCRFEGPCYAIFKNAAKL
jgi:hypothetical protein